MRLVKKPRHHDSGHFENHLPFAIENPAFSRLNAAMSLKKVVEALLFASQKPLLPKEIVTALRGATDFSDEPNVIEFAKTKEAEVGSALAELKTDYLHAGHAFQLVEQVNGWQLNTQPPYAVWVRQLFPEGKPSRLSPPALETLAIIAYRQPITKADIEAVRGVAVDGMIQKLLDASLIRIAGRAEVPGRPLLYESTQFFLEHFGLKSLDELPNSTELRHIKLPTAPILEIPVAEQLPLTPILGNETGEINPQTEHNVATTAPDTEFIPPSDLPIPHSTP